MIIKILLSLLLAIAATSFLIVWLIASHKILLNKKWYLWINNSFLYWEHKAQIRMMTEKELTERIASWEIRPPWYAKYWFGKKLKRKLLKEFDKYIM